MKKPTIACIFITIISIIGCTNSEIDQEIQNISPDTVSSEIVTISTEITVAESSRNDSENAFISDDFLDIFYPHNFRYFETTLLDNTPLYIVDGDETTAIESIPAGTSIRIIAQNNSDANQYYLVRISGDNNMWSGWIRSEYVVPDINEAIRNRSWLSRRWVKVLFANVSTRNNILVTRAQNRDIIVVKRSGKIAHRISVEELFDPGAEASVLRWTTDETIVWLQFFEGPVTFHFGTLDISTGEITLFNPPPGIGEWFSLNPDTGDMWYSDFPVQFDVVQAQMTRESGRIFHLFAFNFFTRERTLIDSNIGEGFFISFDRTNGFTFERMNFFEED